MGNIWVGDSEWVRRRRRVSGWGGERVCYEGRERGWGGEQVGGKKRGMSGTNGTHITSANKLGAVSSLRYFQLLINKSYTQQLLAAKDPTITQKIAKYKYVNMSTGGLL